MGKIIIDSPRLRDLVNSYLQSEDESPDTLKNQEGKILEALADSDITQDFTGTLTIALQNQKKDLVHGILDVFIEKRPDFIPCIKVYDLLMEYSLSSDSDFQKGYLTTIRQILANSTSGDLNKKEVHLSVIWGKYQDLLLPYEINHALGIENKNCVVSEGPGKTVLM